MQDLKPCSACSALTAERDRLALALAIEGGDYQGAPTVEGCQWVRIGATIYMSHTVSDNAHAWINREESGRTGYTWVAYPPPCGQVSGKSQTVLEAMEAIRPHFMCPEPKP